MHIMFLYRLHKINDNTIYNNDDELPSFMFFADIVISRDIQQRNSYYVILHETIQHVQTDKCCTWSDDGK
jgi:hypothetical protein